MSDRVSIAGFVPFTTIDFPGKLAAVIFLSGCPLRCPFCHNPALQGLSAGDNLSWDEITSFLEKRLGKLEGVVLSGGEPLMHPAVCKMARQIKNMGYAVGVHTSGYYPDRLKEMLPILDWVGLDIKAPWDKYALLSGRVGVESRVQKSLDLLLDSNISFEARTTCDPRYLTVSDIQKIAEALHSKNAQTYVLQRYRTFKEDVNPPEESKICSFFQNEDLQSFLKKLFPNYNIR